jgi:hypothetical protein
MPTAADLELGVQVTYATGQCYTQCERRVSDFNALVVLACATAWLAWDTAINFDVEVSILNILSLNILTVLVD